MTAGWRGRLRTETRPGPGQRSRERWRGGGMEAQHQPNEEEGKAQESLAPPQARDCAHPHPTSHPGSHALLQSCTHGGRDCPRSATASGILSTYPQRSLLTGRGVDLGGTGCTMVWWILGGAPLQVPPAPECEASSSFLSFPYVRSPYTSYRSFPEFPTRACPSVPVCCACYSAVPRVPVRGILDARRRCWKRENERKRWMNAVVIQCEPYAEDERDDDDDDDVGVYDAKT
ncbi:hypothetical protein C8Q74DRAFT_147820 [Fomes fomentarius]|nr:hypothetical protein C8Q74DRAFT_147820 [Fomes fomentarius]